MVATEVTLTTFLRDPHSVVEAVEHRDVVLRRRGGPALRLSLESRSQQGGEGVALLSRLLGDVLAGPARGPLLAALEAELAWTALLPEPEREAFLADFVRTARAAADVGVLSPLVAVLAEWKATAALHADPALAADLRRPLPGDGGPVPAPSAR